MNTDSTCCAHHDRLDLARHIDDYQDTPCGTPHPRTGKSDYCCFECPVLLGAQPKPDPARLMRFEP